MVKKFHGISNFAISSADLHWILAPEEPINWKNQFPFSKIKYLTFSRLYNSKTCLYFEILFKCKCKAKETFKTYNS